jgi:acyl dehydratase
MTAVTTPSLFAADFDGLSVGDAHESEPSLITQRDVAVFAALTGDTHPLHTDPDWAAAGPFGELIAHGLLVLSCAAGSLPFDPDRVIALRRIRDVVFKRPFAVGDEVNLVCAVTQLQPIDETTGLVTCEWRITGSDGRLRVRAAAELLWRREAAAEANAGPVEIQRAKPPPTVYRFDPETAPFEPSPDGPRLLI